MADKTAEVLARIEAQKARMQAMEQRRQEKELERKMKIEERDLILQVRENQRRMEIERRQEMERRQQEAVAAAIAEQKAQTEKIKEKMAKLKAKKLKEKEIKKRSSINNATAAPKVKKVSTDKSVLAQKEAGAAAEKKAAEMKRRAKQMADLSDMSAERMRFTNEMDRPVEYCIGNSDHNSDGDASVESLDDMMRKTEAMIARANIDLEETASQASRRKKKAIKKARSVQSESESDSGSSSDSSSSGSSSSSSSASQDNLTIDDSYHSKEYSQPAKTNGKKQKNDGVKKNAIVKVKEPELDLSDLLIKFAEEDNATVFADSFDDFSDSYSVY